MGQYVDRTLLVEKFASSIRNRYYEDIDTPHFLSSSLSASVIMSGPEFRQSSGRKKDDSSVS